MYLLKVSPNCVSLTSAREDENENGGSGDVGVEETDLITTFFGTMKIKDKDSESVEDYCEDESKLHAPGLLEVDGYFLSYLMSVLKSSKVFRTALCSKQAALDNSPDETSFSLMVQTREPYRHFIDRIGNGIVLNTVSEKIEMEHALSWLSTLGGAFSALGDLSSSWAVEAGRVSMAQLRLAFMLEDPLIASRCRLYAAISLLQLGHLSSARKIIEREYAYAKSLPPGFDPKLGRMCQGIWAKLRYASIVHKRVDSGMVMNESYCLRQK